MMRMGVAILVLALLSGCVGVGEQVLVEPPPTPRTDVVLSVVRYADEDTIGAALGWGPGIPGADVVLTAVDGADPELRLTTDAAGQATLPRLRVGTKYLLTARRMLAAAERKTSGPAADVYGFVGMDTVILQGTTHAFTLPAGASRRGSLVIGEWGFEHKFTLSEGYYSHGGYLELYNAADTTIYLDGVIVGEGFSLARDYPSHPCAMYAAAKTPAGIWSVFHQAFPGTGHDHPLAPGQLTLIATDAIDHSVISAGMLDLRTADFEFTGEADVDNPLVPNMINHSIQVYPARVDHGLSFYDLLGIVAFVARPTDVTALSRTPDPSSGRPWRIFPSQLMLDVFTAVSDYTSSPLCANLVHETLDRRYGIFLSAASDNYLSSIHRRVLTDHLPPLFQDTRNSFVDFVRGHRTPGSAPQGAQAWRR